MRFRLYDAGFCEAPPALQALRAPKAGAGRSKLRPVSWSNAARVIPTAFTHVRKNDACLAGCRQLPSRALCHLPYLGHRSVWSHAAPDERPSGGPSLNRRVSGDNQQT